MSKDSPSSPSKGLSHAQWLRRQFSSHSSSSDGQGPVSDGQWPDLLVDRRTLAERRQCNLGPDTLMVERNNIVSISQLVIKSVVDQSLKYGSQLDGDSVPLHQLFVILDIALKHGLKAKKSLLLGKKDIWDLVQHVERVDAGAVEMTNTARQLTTVSTSWGRVRAWLRLATMQKKLADYMKILVDNKALLADYYEAEALMMSEEAVLLCGLLVSLNIVDCNLCLKEEDLDSQEGVIDLTYYLRRKEDIGREASFEEVGDKSFKTVVDQKSYIEEVNRNLAANVMNLEARIESLTKMNALLKEDVAISKRKAAVLEQENSGLKNQLETQAVAAANKERTKVEVSFQNLDPKKEDELEAKLKQLKYSNQELEKELILEVQMKAEMEMAMKLLEKDVHEKQDTIVSLRSQLEDVKTINLELYNKLGEAEKSLDYKTEMIQKLEKKSFAMTKTVDNLERKFADSEKSLTSSKADNVTLASKINDSEGKLFEVESDLKIEREWRERLQEGSVNDRETINNLRQECEFLKTVASDYENLRQDNSRLREQVREGEVTLEELGQQLSWSKLQVTAMKDEQTGAGEWQDDSEVKDCQICTKEFNIGRRRHHCRNCGGIFCDKCSDNKMKLPSSAKPLRVCDNCYTLLLDRQSKLP